MDKLGYKQKLDEVDKAILVNAKFLSEIVSDTKIFGVEMGDVEGDDEMQTEQRGSHAHSHGEGELTSVQNEHDSQIQSLQNYLIHTPIRILMDLMDTGHRNETEKIVRLSLTWINYEAL